MGCFIISQSCIFIGTGDWVIDPSQDYDVSNELWTEINCRFITCYCQVLFQRRQYPFQSWLIESVVAPTPVSAIMHAGIVNAGGIILTLFTSI